MLLSSTIRNIGRWSRAQSLLTQQISNLNRVTPLSCYHHFHKNEDEFTFGRTGFASNINFVNKPTHLHKAIHSNSALYLKYSNLLDQKVTNNVNDRKIEPDDKWQKLDLTALEENKKLGLFARFKKMAKDYWYVLIPVHVATSCVWLGAFYYTSQSGVDIVGILEYYEFNEKIINHLRNSHLGHIAVAYFLYKVATPARYAVTLGGTTFAIQVLSKRGIIKPMPSRDQLTQIYNVKKVEMQQKVADKKQEMQQKVADKKQEMQQKVADKTQDFKDKTQALQDKYMKKE